MYPFHLRAFMREMTQFFVVVVCSLELIHFTKFLQKAIFLFHYRPLIHCREIWLFQRSFSLGTLVILYFRLSLDRHNSALRLVVNSLQETLSFKLNLMPSLYRQWMYASQKSTFDANQDNQVVSSPQLGIFACRYIDDQLPPSWKRDNSARASALQFHCTATLELTQLNLDGMEACWRSRIALGDFPTLL